MSAIVNARRLFTLLLVTLLGSVAGITGANEQRVNPELLELQLIQKPLLRKLGERVYATEFIGYSNHGFIEGDDGIIVIDGGWFPATTAMAMAELRKYTDKPVVAIIYTHLHMDHYGGMGPIMAGQDNDIPVYGPKDWQKWPSRLQKIDREAILRRVYLQMGMLLPRGPDGTVGNGIGPSPIPEANDPLSFPPTIDVDKPMDLEIAGVPLRIMPMEGDVTEHLWVWLPEDRTLFSGDSPPHGVFPAVETARFEIGRNPDEMLNAVETTLAMAPEYVVPGHSRILQGEDNVRAVMEPTRDAIAFLIDQVFRYALSSRSADELLDDQHLPPAIAANPELQPYYHRWEWMVRQRFTKLVGFIDDSMDYLSLNEIDESRRLVPLLGGRERVLALATTAVEGDPRWAARLATYLLQVDTSDAEARVLRQQAFLKVAQTTNSTNERNYLLGLILEEKDEINFSRQLAPLNQRTYTGLPTEQLLQRLKYRFRAEAADDLSFALRVAVDDTSYDLVVHNNVLRVLPATDDKAADVQLSRDDLVDVTARLKSLDALPGWQQGVAAQLTSLIE
ncbi:MAG: alkyl sulfatase dimerization domain-containing protein [Cellvibrionales bacterium]|jgi:alkyl sulfatase BDS1-like metallo-beta-lactamase superfamily hydrolase